MEFVIRTRLGSKDAHYAGGLVDGARILELFGDAATGLLIMLDGDEGLLYKYTSVEFRLPVYAGDFIEAEVRLQRTGNTSRTMFFTARRVIKASRELDSSAEYLTKPEVVALAEGVCVVPLERQRKRQWKNS